MKNRRSGYRRGHKDDSVLGFERPKTAIQWVVFAAAMGLVLSSPMGARHVLKEISRFIDKRAGFAKRPADKSLSQAIYYLRKQKAIILNDKEGEINMRLTVRGNNMLLKYRWENINIHKTEEWDDKWRMIMFDIPEHDRKTRSAFREKIKNLGFLQFQKSVWIYPYPCENEINFISEYLHIAPYINLITVRIDEDGDLRKHFNLNP